MKNIDFIRKLSAKQLSAVLNHSYVSGCDMCVHGDCTGDSDSDCIKGTQKWLKQEYDPSDTFWMGCRNEYGDDLKGKAKK